MDRAREELLRTMGRCVRIKQRAMDCVIDLLHDEGKVPPVRAMGDAMSQPEEKLPKAECRCGGEVTVSRCEYTKQLDVHCIRCGNTVVIDAPDKNGETLITLCEQYRRVTDP